MANKSNKKQSSGPKCVFCGTTTGQFNIFTPRFAPFGTACVECETNLPPGTVIPNQEKKP